VAIPEPVLNERDQSGVKAIIRTSWREGASWRPSRMNLYFGVESDTSQTAKQSLRLMNDLIIFLCTPRSGTQWFASNLQELYSGWVPDFLYQLGD
jgi:hypothetical protein